MLLVGGAYVAAQMMTDTASLRIISVGRFSVDAGTPFYPFTFTLRDLVPKIGAGVPPTLSSGLRPADLTTGPQLGFGMCWRRYGDRCRVDRGRGSLPS